MTLRVPIPDHGCDATAKATTVLFRAVTIFLPPRPFRSFCMAPKKYKKKACQMSRLWSKHDIAMLSGADIVIL
jgi:hypothetical protein